MYVSCSDFSFPRFSVSSMPAGSWQGLVRGITEEYVTEKQLNGLSMDFFLLFWRLSLSDIFIPNRQYEVCISRLDARMKQVRQTLRNQRSLGP